VNTATLKIFTTAFRKVASLNGATNPGDNNVPFDASTYANGLYYYVLEVEAGGKTERKVGKIILAR